jgi:4-cresol dehydrogenase (hydroxylating)
VQLVVALAYDREVPGEDARALACHDRLAARLAALGYPPFRRGLQTHAPDGDGATERLLEALHAAIDPRGILGE